MKHVIIGNSAAGIFAAENIRRSKPLDEIVILSDESEPAYSKCLTSYYIAGKVDEQKMLIRPRSFYNDANIDFRGGERVTEVDVDQMFVRTASNSIINYDKLLIASGASALRPDTPGINGSGVFVLRTISDARGIVEQSKKTNQAIVGGGGLVSLKAAYALINRGLKVTIVIASRQILSQVLDEKSAVIIQKHLEMNGVKFIFGQDIQEILLDGEKECRGIKLNNGEELPCGLVIIGKGVKANTQFLRDNIIDARKGLLVDNRMQTGIGAVYAAGDVACSFDYLTGEPVSYAIWPNAAEQGEIAGLNMAGRETLYQGALSMNSMNFFGLNTISAGDCRARNSDSEIHEEYEPQDNSYKKFVFRKGIFSGYILMGDITRAGILTGMIGKSTTFEGCLELLQKGAARMISL